MSQSENGPAAPAGSGVNGVARPNGFRHEPLAAPTHRPAPHPGTQTPARTPVPRPPAPSADEFEEERARLEAELAKAKARLAAARSRAATAEAEMKAALRRELATFQSALAELDRQHEENMATVRRSTEAEVARIIAEAHESDDPIDEGPT